MTTQRDSEVVDPDFGESWRGRGSRNPGAAGAAAQAFLDALGFDTSTAATSRTAERMAAAYAELLDPPAFEPVSFVNEGPFTGLVLVRDIEFVSLCEHHALPFFGSAVLAYVPGDRIVGLSKLARVVTQVSRRPQVQERMSAQLCQWLVDELEPLGAGVVMDAHHTCMSMRGARASSASTRTSVFWGSIDRDRDLRQELLGSGGAQR